MNAPTRPLRIALIAGEASGDLLGASLMRQLKQLHPDIELAGVGGEQMAAQGLTLWADCSELSVMGLAEVIVHLPRLLWLRYKLKRKLRAWRPDVFIGIDAPDFNLALERWLKQRGVKTVHYVSPSIWAWRESRAQKMKANADLVLCLFPMEPAIYQKYGVNAVFVGHPQASKFALSPDRIEARKSLNLPISTRCIALLPGSRHSEIKRLLPDFLHAFALLRAADPQLSALIPAANRSCRTVIDEQLKSILLTDATSAVHVFDGQAQACMIAADAVLLASGTAALEAMLAKRPMVVAYRINGLSYWLVKRLDLLKIDYVSLPNVLAKQLLVAECLQHDCTPENLAAHMQTLLSNLDQQQVLVSRFKEIHLSLLPPNAQLAAKAVLKLLSA